MTEVMKIIASMFESGIAKILAMFAVGVIFWFIGRRKTETDIHKTEIDAASTSINILRGTIEALTARISGLESEVSGLKQSNEDLKYLNEKHLSIESANNELILQMAEILCADMSCTNRCRLKIKKNSSGGFQFVEDNKNEKH